MKICAVAGPDPIEESNAGSRGSIGNDISKQGTAINRNEEVLE
jgi:hypothetical protein